MYPFRSLSNAFPLIFSMAIPGAAQGIWTIQRPVPTNNHLFAIKAIDKEVVLAGGEFGQVYRTADGGATWKIVPTGVPYTLRGISAGPGERNVLFAVGDTGTILATLDGGHTWNPQASGTKAHLKSVSAVDAKTAFACGAGGTVLRTTDGGASWARLETGTQSEFKSIAAPNARTLYAATRRDTVYMSTDGGSTWRTGVPGPLKGMNENGSGIHGVSAVGPDTVFVSALDVHNSVPKGCVFRSVDGGANWSRIDSAGGITYAISAVSGKTAFVSGFADMHTTQDAGATWTTVSSPKVNSGYVQSNDAVSAVDAQTAFATGSFGMILATTDGGRTWIPKPGHQPGVSLNSIRAVSPTLAFASGGDYTFLKTTNGSDWKALPLDPKLSIYGLDTRDGALILAAAGNAMMRSTDGGATWAAKTIAGTGSVLSRIAFADARTAYAAGQAGAVARTTDGGETWSVLPAPTPRNIQAIQALDPAYAVAACDSGLLIRTKDGGATWDSLPTGTRNNLYALHFVNKSVGWITGTRGTLKRTRDGGATWDSLPPPNWWDAVYAVAALDEKTVYITGYRGRILKSSDGGNTWANEVSGTYSTLSSISLVDGNTAYAAGGFGTIVKYTGLSAPIRPGAPRARIATLRYLSGRLHAELPAAGPVTGRILTAQGRTLSELDFGRLEAGPHALPLPTRHGGPHVLELRQHGIRSPLLLPRAP